MTQTHSKLMTAAWRNSADKIKRLIDQGDDVNKKHETGLCPHNYW